MSVSEIDQLRTVAAYQFGSGAGRALFPEGADFEMHRSASGRPRQVHLDGDRLVTLGTDGRFTLGLAGGRHLAAELSHPTYRVVVGDESEPFVRDGKNVFNKFVIEADPAIRAGDEVIVTHERGDVIGVGRAEVDAGSMADFETGMAVLIREGAGED